MRNLPVRRSFLPEHDYENHRLIVLLRECRLLLTVTDMLNGQFIRT